MDLLRRNREVAIALLVFLVSALALANALKTRPGSIEIFTSQKDAIDGATKLIASVVLVLGSIASYFRFFRGRTLAQRAELQVKVAVHEARAGEFLHVVTVVFRNLGAVPIWNPGLHVVMQSHGDQQRPPSMIDDWWAPTVEQNESKLVTVVDSGEASSYHATRLFEDGLWAVTYFATIKGDRGTIWNAGVTVANKPGAHSEAAG